ncbi:MAG TPA: phosphatidylglycerophosphatase A [Planctomycetota bacterium]|nr:phosphatidylglycerophosphatase A [Planctomycetota bacterium]
MNFGDRLRWLLITSGGLGSSPIVPGTVGTLGGVAIAVLVQVLWPAQAVPIWWAVAAVLLLLGCMQSAFVARVFQREDPGPFVLDEVVGYLVTVALYASVRHLPDAVGHTAAFFAFRVFDVLKPQPAKKLEDLPGAFGIMADDVAAGVYAGLSLWLCLPLVNH